MVSNAVHLKALEDLATERGRREVLERATEQHEYLTRFFCARINQLEKERAILLRRATNVEIPYPEISPATPPRSATPPDLVDLLSGAGAGSMFEDIGDDAARAQGITYGTDGSVAYGPPSKKETASDA